MRVVFMGTPDFAVPSLEKLAMSSHQIAGVVTQPDRPKGRGLKPSPSPVKKIAQRLSLSIQQPDQLKDPLFIESLKQWQADCFIVVGFRILPSDVFEIPPKGTVNLHASLLPKYRGAAPVQWAIINGEKETGVTTFFIEKKVDTGNLILQDSTPIGEHETAGELHDRLAELGADLLLKTADLIDQDRVKPIPQTGTPTLAPKILPEHCLIDWNQSAESLLNLIRGLSPQPGAYTFWGGKRIKIFNASVHENTKMGKSGELISVDENSIIVQTSKGRLNISQLQLEGKRRLSTSDFLRGHQMRTGDLLG